MLTQSNKNEYEIASRLVKDGFLSAKKALQQILQTPIAIQILDTYSHEIQRKALLNQPIYALKTQLKGEIGGSCYLMFSSDDVVKILASCPEGLNLSNDAASSGEFLKEIDNIVAGSMVTQFANHLGIFVYGDIPHMTTLEPDRIEDFLHTESQLYDSVMYYEAILNGPSMSITPHFVWMFNNTLLDRIKELLTSETIQT